MKNFYLLLIIAIGLYVFTGYKKENNNNGCNNPTKTVIENIPAAVQIVNGTVRIVPKEQLM
ncbi:MAG: hypothetical protein ACK5NK_03395 [Niabella sp.]